MESLKSGPEEQRKHSHLSNSVRSRNAVLCGGKNALSYIHSWVSGWVPKSVGMPEVIHLAFHCLISHFLYGSPQNIFIQVNVWKQMQTLNRSVQWASGRVWLEILPFIKKNKTGTWIFYPWFYQIPHYQPVWDEQLHFDLSAVVWAEILREKKLSLWPKNYTFPWSHFILKGKKKKTPHPRLHVMHLNVIFHLIL